MLIDTDGQNVGVISFEEAYEKAQKAGLDLVAVSPNTNPPVCKILDFNKLKYQKSKKQKPARAGRTKMREIKFRAVTDDNDYRIKLKKIISFIEKGDKVQVSIRFRGREIMNQQDIALNLLNRVVNDLSENTQIDREPKLEGRQMTMHLIPKRAKSTTSDNDA
jgi:translation initiation factor IF-3